MEASFGSTPTIYVFYGLLPFRGNNSAILDELNKGKIIKSYEIRFL